MSLQLVRVRVHSVFSFRIEMLIWNEMSIRNHVNPGRDFMRSGMKGASGRTI